MRWIATLAASTLLLISPAANAAGTLCAELTALTAYAGASPEPLHINAWLDPDVFACGPTSVDTRAFCNAAIEASGIEFAHIYPWRLRDCLAARGIRSHITQQAGWTGLARRKRIVHLTARLGDGMALDVRWKPDGDAGLYGKYALTIWRP
jgi:hypothetical protein